MGYSELRGGIRSLMPAVLYVVAGQALVWDPVATASGSVVRGD
jgi:hypothetical protein